MDTIKSRSARFEIMNGSLKVLLDVQENQLTTTPNLVNQLDMS